MSMLPSLSLVCRLSFCVLQSLMLTCCGAGHNVTACLPDAGVIHIRRKRLRPSGVEPRRPVSFRADSPACHHVQRDPGRRATADDKPQIPLSRRQGRTDAAGDTTKDSVAARLKKAVLSQLRILVRGASGVAISDFRPRPKPPLPDGQAPEEAPSRSPFPPGVFSEHFLPHERPCLGLPRALRAAFAGACGAHTPAAAGPGRRMVSTKGGWFRV